ncbi:MAG: hypothetical protein HY804_05780 [Nitrospinae bacterium]|nr:hypothetical protein [Nitrospinota bacterium]
MDANKRLEARRMRHIYAALALDGRCRKAKYFAARWRVLSPKLGGDPVKEALLVRALKFEVDNPAMTGHELDFLFRSYAKLGLLGNAAGDDDETFDNYLQGKR